MSIIAMMIRVIKAWMVILCVLPTSFCLAQKTAPGYYITLSNDTIRSTIKLSNFTDEEGVQIVDSGLTKLFNPSQIKGYGYNYKGKDFVFVSKPVNQFRKRFLEPELQGKRVSLYSRHYSTPDGTYYSPGFSAGPGMYSGTPARTVYYYTFEKSNGAVIFTDTDEKFATFKQKLMDFFSDSPKTRSEIEKRFASKPSYKKFHKQLFEILETYNNELRS
jgi:hypothetical protein